MPNPTPQHTPTDGLGVAAYVQLAGTGVTPYLTPSAGHPNPAHYRVTLSVSGANGNASSVVLTPSLVDVSDTAYTTTNTQNWVYRSYNDPQITEASLYTGPNPTNLLPVPTQTAKIASVGASGGATGTVTALNPGHAVVEVVFPTFDNLEGSVTVGNLGGPSAGNKVPIDAIYAVLDVLVTP